MIFKGSAVAIVSPFTEKGIDYPKFKELIEFQIKNGTDAIVVCGTTGESSTMTDKERKDIIRFTVDTVQKRIPVIAGTGTNNTDYSIELSKFAQNVGVDCLLLVTPYYNKCTQKGLIEHFSKIASNVNIPCILYNVPSRTGVNILPETVFELSKIDNIVGIKEASGNISQVAEILSKVNNNFYVYSGNDDQNIPILSLGGKGTISVLANILPKQTRDMIHLYLSGNTDKARDIQIRYLELIKQLFIEVNPIPIKEAMNMIGLNVGKCRLPLTEMEEKNIINLKKEIQKVGLI